MISSVIGSHLNNLSVEFKIIKIRHRDQKLSLFFKGLAVLISEVLDWLEVLDDIPIWGSLSWFEVLIRKFLIELKSEPRISCE